MSIVNQHYHKEEDKQINLSDGPAYLKPADVVAMQIVPYTTSAEGLQCLTFYLSSGFKVTKIGTIEECKAFQEQFATYYTFEKVE